MPFTMLIFTKLTPARQLFVKNCYTIFHENMTNGLVSDTRSQSERWTWSPHKMFFFIS